MEQIKQSIESNTQTDLEKLQGRFSDKIYLKTGKTKYRLISNIRK